MDTLDLIRLTAQDRCDRCGAQARHLARKGELEILFCNHHKVEHDPALATDGWIIISDETESK